MHAWGTRPYSYSFCVLTCPQRARSTRAPGTSPCSASSSPATAPKVTRSHLLMTTTSAHATCTHPPHVRPSSEHTCSKPQAMPGRWD